MFVPVDGYTFASRLQTLKQGECFINLKFIRKYTTKRNWNDEETKLLNWAIHTYCVKRGNKAKNFSSTDWQNVAKLVPGRNDAQCQYKWNQSHKSTITKIQWSKKEDEELFRIITLKGTKQWQEIAEVLNDYLGVVRNGKQCRERWYNFLNPEINREPFTPEEDLQILKLRKDIGNRWSEIVKLLAGRTENSVKNRFNCMYKKVKDDKLQKLQDQNMNEALHKINQAASGTIVPETLIDEDEVIDILIEIKSRQVGQIVATLKKPADQGVVEEQKH